VEKFKQKLFTLALISKKSKKYFENSWKPTEKRAYWLITFYELISRYGIGYHNSLK